MTGEYFCLRPADFVPVLLMADAFNKSPVLLCVWFTGTVSINILFQCENGIHSALDEDMLLSIEGIYKLPLIKTEDDKHDRTTLAFADSQVSAKILIIHTIPAFFISDGNVWVPCKARKYQQGSTK